MRKLWNENTECCKCKNKVIYSTPHPYREYDKNKYWTGRWLCNKCYNENLYPYNKYKEEYEEYKLRLNVCQICGNTKTTGNWHIHSENGRRICKSCSDKYDPNSYPGIIKRLTKSRNKLLSKNTTKGKGFRIEQAILKTLGFENCNIEKDNFGYKYDSYNPELGRIEIKSGYLEFGDGFKYYEWKFGEIDIKNCDTIFLVCMDKEYKNILRVYKIPTQYIEIRYIRINPNTENKWKWNKFRIDEKSFDDAYHNMRIEDCQILKNE